MTTNNQPNSLHNPIKSFTNSAFFREFKEFINRGSVVDLAIGVAVGGAFTAIVKSLVDDIIMPISSLLAGGLDFSSLAIDIPNIFGANTVAHIAYGNFLQNVVNFILIAFVIFIVVRAMNKLNRHNDTETAKATAAKEKADNAAADQRALKAAKTIAAESKTQSEATGKSHRGFKNRLKKLPINKLSTVLFLRSLRNTPSPS